MNFLSLFQVFWSYSWFLLSFHLDWWCLCKKIVKIVLLCCMRVGLHVSVQICLGPFLSISLDLSCLLFSDGFLLFLLGSIVNNNGSFVVHLLIILSLFSLFFLFNSILIWSSLSVASLLLLGSFIRFSCTCIASFQPSISSFSHCSEREIWTSLDVARATLLYLDVHFRYLRDILRKKDIEKRSCFADSIWLLLIDYRSILIWYNSLIAFE